MTFDVARVRGLHPALGDGWTRFDAQAGMVIPESVATTVATAFRGATANIHSPHPAAQRSLAVLDAAAWGGPPIGALVFRNPAVIDTFGSVSTDPRASGPARLELGAHQYALLAGVVASVEYLAALDEAASGTRREKLRQSMASAATYLSDLFDYTMSSLRSLPLATIIGSPSTRIPLVSFVVDGVPAERVVQRLADNGVLATATARSRVLDVLGVNEIGGAVTIGLAHYSTMGEVDHLVRTLASLG